MEMLRTGESDDTNPSDGLSPEQEAAVRAAVEHGYYESPRETDVGDLAEHLDIPRSTLTYRLRRAEEQLAKAYVSETRLAESSPAL